MTQRIVIVEDDADQRNNYQDAIQKKGYEVVAYDNRESALAGFEERGADLVILDIILKEKTDDEIDKISGLRMGAWDF